MKLELPRDLLGALQAAERERGVVLKRVIAREHFREERFSMGTAADVLGLSTVEFIDLLDRHGSAYFAETPAELEAQMEAVGEMLEYS